MPLPKWMLSLSTGSLHQRLHFSIWKMANRATDNVADRWAHRIIGRR